jgi:1-acyl-sn-glycerol-3-phosphate acyltransferase
MPFCSDLWLPKYVFEKSLKKMSHFFIHIFDFFRHRKTLLWLLLAGIVALLAVSASRISFVEDISSFFPNSADNKQINEAYRHIGAINKIIVTISENDEHAGEDANEDLLTAAAMRFAEILQANDSARHIKSLMYEIDSENINKVANFITQNLPFFLEEDDYARIDSLIRPQNIENQLKADKELLMSPMGGFVRDVILHDPLHFSQNALKNLEAFKQNDNYNTDNGFIFNKKGGCIVVITSKYPVSETANNKLLADEIYSAVRQTVSEFKHEIKIVPFGAALVSITNADQIKSDSIFAVSIALALILALLFYFFRNLKPLFFIVISVTFGALFSLGVMALFNSTISIIAIGISSIIFGIAINYPLHFLAHNQHVTDTLRTLREIVNPLLIGNITTVGAFLSLFFISSPAMHDLGLFSSLLLVGTIVFVLIFLPQMFINVRYVATANHKSQIFSRLAEFSPERNKLIVLVFLVFTVALFLFSFGAKFETNLQAINYMTDEQRAEMNNLMEENQGKGKTVYCAIEGLDIQAALHNYEQQIPAVIRLMDSSLISSSAGIGNFFPSKYAQERKIRRWNEFWENKKEIFLHNFNKISEKQAFNFGVFEDFMELLNEDFHAQPFEYFEPLYKDLSEHYFAKIDDGSVLIYTVFNTNNPEKLILALEKYIKEPIIFDETSIAQKMVDALSDDFNSVLYICGFIVFAFLFFSFGRIELAILTFIPLTVGWVWILGLMNIFGLKFNIVNIILATFIFGQGDDYTIFVTEGLIYEYTYRRKMLASFKKSIMLSATILFIAIGMLIFAKHPAMRSLAELTMVGMVSVVACAYLFPSLIFRWLVYSKDKNRIMPITLWNLAKTVFSFTVFLAYCIIVTFCGFFILTIGGKTRKNKLLYHHILCRGFRILAKWIPQVKYKIHNPHGENFEKPAIIISNHQSHLDLLYTLLLSPKIIVLTNKRVWNSPFYGWVIRYADFLPVADGLERHTGKLQKLVDEGYSILVFPEGTRSPDCSIGRFHKGAFYLASKFGLDIVPVVIHGNGHVFPKQEFILRKGQVDVVVCERQSLLSFNNLNDESSLLEASKYFRKFYQEKYAEIVHQTETPEYFADKVLKNYIYKGADIARAVRKSLKKHDNFRTDIEKLPEMGEITIQNTGYGEFALMAALVRKNLKINATESDVEKFEIARSCASVPQNLKFIIRYEQIL